MSIFPMRQRENHIKWGELWIPPLTAQNQECGESHIEINHSKIKNKIIIIKWIELHIEIHHRKTKVDNYYGK